MFIISYLFNYLHKIKSSQQVFDLDIRLHKETYKHLKTPKTLKYKTLLYVA